MPWPANGREPSGATNPQPASSRSTSASIERRSTRAARRSCARTCRRARRSAARRASGARRARARRRRARRRARTPASCSRAARRTRRDARTAAAHAFTSSSSSFSAFAGIGGGRGSVTCITSTLYAMSFSASGCTSRTSTSSPVIFTIWRITFIFALSSLAATSFSPTASLASFGKSDLLHHLESDAIAGLPNASLGLSDPSRLAPGSSPSSDGFEPGAASCRRPGRTRRCSSRAAGRPTTERSTLSVTRRPFSIFTTSE